MAAIQTCESLLAADISFACEDLGVAGLEQDAIIINRKDVDFASCVIDNSNSNIITTLALKSGKYGWSCIQYGNTPFTGTQSALEVGTYRNTFTHTLNLVVLSNTPDAAHDIVDGFANGTFVVVVRNKFKGTANKAEYQVYGYGQGLHPVEITNDKYSEETNGGWLVSLQETGARESAMFFYDTDAATTAAAYDNLLAP